MKETNWGIIGPENIAHNFARDLRLIPVLQRITAIMGHNSKSVDKFARESNVQDIYTDFTELLKNKTIDAVYIAIPHSHQQPGEDQLL